MSDNKFRQFQDNHIQILQDIILTSFLAHFVNIVIIVTVFSKDFI